MRWTRDVPTRRSSVLRTALMVPLSVARPSAVATSRARTSVSPTCERWVRICSVSWPYALSASFFRGEAFFEREAPVPAFSSRRSGREVAVASAGATRAVSEPVLDRGVDAAAGCRRGPRGCAAEAVSSGPVITLSRARTARRTVSRWAATAASSLSSDRFCNSRRSRSPWSPAAVLSMLRVVRDPKTMSPSSPAHPQLTCHNPVQLRCGAGTTRRDLGKCCGEW